MPAGVSHFGISLTPAQSPKRPTRTCSNDWRVPGRDLGSLNEIDQIETIATFSRIYSEGRCFAPDDWCVADFEPHRTTDDQRMNVFRPTWSSRLATRVLPPSSISSPIVLESSWHSRSRGKTSDKRAERQYFAETAPLMTRQEKASVGLPVGGGSTRSRDQSKQWLKAQALKE